jgi:NAD(P)-dependent dehydrogenase (short-subunit alcohol dehydrogenase family)
MKDLEGRVAVVAGATRGAGRGIATMLGEAGATEVLLIPVLASVQQPQGRLRHSIRGWMLTPT